MEEFDEVNKKLVEKQTVNKLCCVGKNIKYLRKKNKLSQQDVAFFIFADSSLISNLERNCLKNCTLMTLIKIAELFHVELEDLFKENL